MRKDGLVRVLFSSLSALGHVHPLLPLALACRDRGHEVRWATGPDGCGRVERAGIPAVPAGMTQADKLAAFWRRHPDVRALPPQQWPDIMFPKLFGEVSAPPALADLLPLVTTWRPDVVVHDAAELAAPIAAAAVGVPHVTHGFGALLPEPRVRAAGDEVAPLWRRHGLEPRPYGGSYDHLYLDIYPPRLRSGEDDHVRARQPLRPVPVDEATDDALPAHLREEGRPLVYLTFGTVFNDNRAFRAALAAIRDLPVKVVVTVGPTGDPEAFGPQPSHVVVQRYVPQMRLLPSCDVVVSHGGSGTVLATLQLGIPQLCLPQAADQFINAAAVARSGAGLQIPPEEVEAAGVAAAVEVLLGDAAFRQHAQRVGDEIASMPSPDEVAVVLETLA